MAAVFALVGVPLVCSLTYLASVTRGEGSLVSGFAMMTFALLGIGLLFGLLRFVRGLEQ